MGLELVDKPERKNETPVIEINVDAKCSLCGGKGAIVKTGKCMKCVGKEISAKIKADREPKFFEAVKDQQFAVAHEAANIGKDLVERFHEHLLNTRIDYVFLWKTPEKNKREIWGRAKKVSGLSAWFASEDRENEPLPDTFFVIELSYLVWRALEPKQKIALIDHELSHCSINDKLKPCLKSHDCEEFNQIVRRHGLWAEDVRRLLEAAKEAEENPLFA